jgi:hypothetical protein
MSTFALETSSTLVGAAETAETTFHPQASVLYAEWIALDGRWFSQLVEEGVQGRRYRWWDVQRSRRKAATRLALAGCTETEIAAITGHTLRDVRSIRGANYLHRDPALAEAAIRKLQERTKSPNRRSCYA